MYPPGLLFSADNRRWEEGLSWFQDRIHYPDVVLPLEVITVEATRLAVSHYSGRVFAVPGSYGLEWRILNGYVYATAVPVTDPERVAARQQVFAERAQAYYSGWDAEVARWTGEVRALIGRLDRVEIPALDRIEPWHARRVGEGSGYRLVRGYQEVLDTAFQAWQLHFELLNLGYAAHLNFFDVCRQLFPGIRDDAVAAMVSAGPSLMTRPDRELAGLAARAIELGVDDLILARPGPEEACRELERLPAGRDWTAAFRGVRDQWFHVCDGNGFYQRDRAWTEDLGTPWRRLRGHLDRARAGEQVDTAPAGPDADRVVAGYRDLIEDTADRQLFDRSHRLARKVTSYTEDHNFYIEHWYHTTLWRKLRELGGAMALGGVLETADDVFLLGRAEVGEALLDVACLWATGAPGEASGRWHRLVHRRRATVAALRGQPPVPWVGEPAGGLEDPLVAMLFGVRHDTGPVSDGAAEAGDLRGTPVSGGVHEGPAKVVRAEADLAGLRGGEVLVCPSLLPAWSASLRAAGGVVTELGGIMSHTAILCRELGLPAVTAVPGATARIADGQRVRVDGNDGAVSVVGPGEEAGPS
jgi:pyruvate,water dikinase